MISLNQAIELVRLCATEDRILNERYEALILESKEAANRAHDSSNRLADAESVLIAVVLGKEPRPDHVAQFANYFK